MSHALGATNRTEPATEEQPKTMKILVVEDDALVREMVVQCLTDEGFEVIAAETGEEALSHCRENWPEFLFTDIRLPGRINGWDIAEHCRESNPGIPVIYATGHSHVTPRPVPGSIWFQKPYRPQQLVDAIRVLSESADRPRCEYR